MPYAPDYTILREILTVTDHSAYHLGKFALMREVMDTWPKKQPRAFGSPWALIPP